MSKARSSVSSVGRPRLRGRRSLGLIVLGWALLNVAQAGTTITTTTAFDYDADGWLRKEMVEQPTSNLCLVTERIPDAYGHTLKSTTRNCNGAAGVTLGSPAEAASPGAPAAFAPRDTTFTYTTDQRFVASVTNGVGLKAIRSYDGRFGTVATIQDPNLLVASASYDGFGRITVQTRPDGNKVRWDYVYCANGGTTGYITVPPGAVQTSCTAVPTYAGPGVVPIYYVQQTPVQSDGVTAYGPYTRVYFDETNREVRTETQGFDGGGSSTLIYRDTAYDPNGRIGSKSRPYYANQTAYYVTYTYDALDRVTDVNQPTDTTASGAVTHTAYNGLTVTTIDALNHSTVDTFNPVGKVSITQDAKSGVLTRTYDALGNPTATQDAKGNVITMTYDTRGRKLSINDPDLGLTTSIYNAAGDLYSQTDAKSQTMTFTYDGISRIKSSTGSTQTNNWYYDNTYADGTTPCTMGKGKLCEATSTIGYARRHFYDALGRPTTTTTVSGGTYSATTGYDIFSRVSTQTYPGGLVTRNAYTTGLGFLNQVIDGRAGGGVLWTANALDASDRLTQYTYGNSIVNTDLYFATTGALSTQAAGPSNGIQSLTYVHDAVGRLTTRTDGVTTVSAIYGYDELNRLTSESISGGSVGGAVVTSWGFDSIGNLQTWDETGATATSKTYTYNASGLGSVQPHAVASVAGTVNGSLNPSYQYDGNGNLTSGAGRSVTWTSFDKVASISQGSKRLDYVYDAENQRTREGYYLNGALQRTTVYLNPANGGGLFYEEESGVAGTKKKHYVSAGGRAFAVINCAATDCTLPANTVTQYLHKDHLGSVSVVTNATGGVVERLAFEPFGKRRNVNGLSDPNGTLVGVSTDRGYTEHEHMDEVGLINMNGRVFDPALGRFMSADPTVTNPDDLQSFNRYSYVMNSPTGYVDPSGYEATASLAAVTVTGHGESFSGGPGGPASPADVLAKLMNLINRIGNVKSVAISPNNVLTIISGPSSNGVGGPANGGSDGPAVSAAISNQSPTALTAAAPTVVAPASVAPAANAPTASSTPGGATSIAATIQNWLGTLSNPFNQLIPSGENFEAQARQFIGPCMGDCSNRDITAHGLATSMSGAAGAVAEVANEYLTVSLMFTPAGNAPRLGPSARVLAKAEVFAARKAPALKAIYGWGNGIEGAKRARASLDASAMARIQSSVTRADVESARNMYRAAAVEARGGAVASERAALMEDILKLWK